MLVSAASLRIYFEDSYPPKRDAAVASDVIGTVAAPEIAYQRELAKRLFSGYAGAAYAVRFWDGS